MPIYEYDCPAGHRMELVRPIGTEHVQCGPCADVGVDGVAVRSHIHHFDVVGPTVDTRGMARRFTEASQEREAVFAKVERETGQSVARPDDIGPARAEARARLYHGELDRDLVHRTTVQHTYHSSSHPKYRRNR